MRRQAVQTIIIVKRIVATAALLLLVNIVSWGASAAESRPLDHSNEELGQAVVQLRAHIIHGDIPNLDSELASNAIAGLAESDQKSLSIIPARAVADTFFRGTLVAIGPHNETGTLVLLYNPFCDLAILLKISEGGGNTEDKISEFRFLEGKHIIYVASGSKHMPAASEVNATIANTLSAFATVVSRGDKFEDILKYAPEEHFDARVMAKYYSPAGSILSLAPSEGDAVKKFKNSLTFDSLKEGTKPAAPPNNDTRFDVFWVSGEVSERVILLSDSINPGFMLRAHTSTQDAITNVTKIEAVNIMPTP